MSVKIMVGGQMKVVADVIAPGSITKISSLFKIYSGAEWLTCDGSAIPRVAYADLFAAIGTTYGPGDGVSTFDIPTQAQAVRVSYNVTSTTTFDDPFASDTDIVVNNPSAAYVDISVGAAGAGIRVSIIEQSAQGVTVYTDAAHTQSCLLQKGVLALRWDGTSWVCESAHGDVSLFLTAGTSFKIPFSGRWNLTLLGGGGSGGGVREGGGSTTGGGGGAGQKLTKQLYLAMGTSVTCAIGAAGTNTGHGTGSDGGPTTATIGSVTLSADGGKAGGGGTGSASCGAGGAGGSARAYPNCDYTVSGLSGDTGTPSTSGKGAATEYGSGGAARTSSGNGNPAPATSYGAGGGGANNNGSADLDGSSGASGALVAVPAA
jgi:hypothetical protein